MKPFALYANFSAHDKETIDEVEVEVFYRKPILKFNNQTGRAPLERIWFKVTATSWQNRRWTVRRFEPASA